MPVLLIAIGCAQLNEMKEIIKSHRQVLIGSMDGQRLASLTYAKDKSEIPVYFYETGWDNLRRIVAVGSLQNLILVEAVSDEAELARELSRQVGGFWQRILMGGDKPFSYHSYNDLYLVIKDLVVAEQGTVLSLLSKYNDVYNIIAG